MPNLYPIFIPLAKMPCLVAGLGKVGRRKLASLLDCGPESVLVLEKRSLEEMDGEAARLLGYPGVKFENRNFREEDLKCRPLVFAATNDAGENSRIARLCADAGVFCDCASNPGASSFFSAALARSGGLCAAISTGGQSPLLAGKWRRELEKWLESKAETAWLLGKLRPLITASGDCREHRAAFEKIANSDLLVWLKGNEPEKCRKWLLKELPGLDPAAIGGILAEYRNAFS